MKLSELFTNETLFKNRDDLMNCDLAVVFYSVDGKGVSATPICKVGTDGWTLYLEVEDKLMLLDQKES